MILPNSELAVVQEAKIVDYLLKLARCEPCPRAGCQVTVFLCLLGRSDGQSGKEKCEGRAMPEHAGDLDTAAV